MKTAFEKLLLTAPAVLLLCATYAAAAGQPSADQFVMKGQVAFGRGDVKNSLKYVYMFLIENPENQEAKFFLKKIAESRKLSAGLQIQSEQIIELLDYISFLQTRTKQLEDKSGGVKAQIVRIDPEDLLLARTIELIVNQTKVLNQDNKPKIKSDDTDESYADQLKLLLAAKKDRMVSNVKNLNARLKKLEELKERTWESENILSEVRMAMASRDQELNQLKRDNEDFRKIALEFNAVRGEMTSLRTTVSQLLIKIDMVTKELAGKTLELYEKESIVADQKERLGKLEDSLVDAQERLSLVQRIISEKDERIAALEANMKPLEDELANLQSHIDSDRVMDKERLSSIEKFLAEQEKQIAEYSAQVQIKDDEISKLNDALRYKVRSVDDLENIVRSKDDKLIELNGIIQIYKIKLSDTNRILTIKSQSMDELEAMLRKNVMELDLSQRTTRELYERILDLEPHFTKFKSGPNEIRRRSNE